MLNIANLAPAKHGRTRRSTGRATLRMAVGSAAACAALALWPATAQAVANDAVQGCGAYDVVAKQGATVPSSTRSHEIFHVITTDGRFPILCGNGSSYGVFHIEVKHQVPDWPDALSCITKAINRTNGVFSAGTGKTTYTYSFSGGTVKVVTGGYCILTAYPPGSGVATKWKSCSTS